MNLDKFTKIDANIQKEIYGGAFFAIFTALIPLITSSIISIIGAAKVAQSNSGEIKLKDGTSQKFSNPEPKEINAKTQNIVPIYFVY